MTSVESQRAVFWNVLNCVNKSRDNKFSYLLIILRSISQKFISPRFLSFPVFFT